MNIQKYILPASVAATVHVALLWFLPEESYTRVIEVPLVKTPPPPPIPEKPFEIPDDKKAEEPGSEVRPLAGGPTPPDIAEIMKLPDKDAFTIPVEETPKFVVPGLKVVPKNPGPGDFDGPGRMGELEIFRPDGLDRTPRAKVQMPPDYPYSMKHAGTGGSVIVEFDVDTTGRVVRATALNYSDRDFVEPALRAVRNWRFEPGRRSGKAVPFRMTIPIEFSLEDAR